MKKSFVLLVLASALPLAAQSFEAGLTYHWNPGKSTDVDTGGGSSANVKCDTWKAAGLRFGWVFFQNGNMDVQANAAYQFKNKQDLLVNGAASGITEEYGYWGIGAAVSWNLPVRLGVGLEYRSEKITIGVPGGSPYDGQGTTYGRPWLRGEATYTFGSAPAKPFIGIDAAFPLTSSTLNASDFSTPNIDNINKGVAPKAEYGVYLGVRF